MKILVTGSDGFVGKNLRSILSTLSHNVVTFDKSDKPSDLLMLTKDCDAIVHLAGVNRPLNTDEFYQGNATLTDQLCQAIAQNKNKCPIIVSSSVQAERDNDYGKSKKLAEESILNLGKTNGNKTYIFRFKNLYGKWARPNYNSVVATWCYNIARGLAVNIDNPDTQLELCYIDDVVSAIIGKLDGTNRSGYFDVAETDSTTLQELHDLILSFKVSRETYFAPNQNSRLNKNLYATYLSYLPEDSFSYALNTHTDDRGSFTEIFKSANDGQFSVNISKPGVTKGQHWHSTKNEKFLVVSGRGVIRLRDVFSKNVIEYLVSGNKLEVVDIPTGYTHNIINLGKTDMVTIMWASESFNPDKPDTNYQEV